MLPARRISLAPRLDQGCPDGSLSEAAKGATRGRAQSCGPSLTFVGTVYEIHEPPDSQSESADTT
ncbi:MAG: hypothetical protein O3C69_06880 [Chloroflexi bacterium]|nr:hypothetical protein [Chloroflexota bacterium]